MSEHRKYIWFIMLVVLSFSNSIEGGSSNDIRHRRLWRILEVIRAWAFEDLIHQTDKRMILPQSTSFNYVGEK